MIQVNLIGNRYSRRFSSVDRVGIGVWLTSWHYDEQRRTHQRKASGGIRLTDRLVGAPGALRLRYEGSVKMLRPINLGKSKPLALR